MAGSVDAHSTRVIDVGQETAADRTQSNLPSGIQGEPQMLSIRLDKLPLLESLQQKVERNYCVEIRKDTCLMDDNGKPAPDMQWISILGSKGDCKDAGVRI